MNTTRWYILAVAALIVAVYVSTQCRQRYFHYGIENIVTDSWTGISYESKLIDFEGNEIEWPKNLFYTGPEFEPDFERDPRTVNPNPEEAREVEVDPATGHYRDFREE